MDEKCILCLKTFSSQEECYGVTEEVKEAYKNLTQKEIFVPTKHKHIICELCFGYLQLANSLKNKLIKNQQKHQARQELKEKLNKNKGPEHLKSLEGEKSKNDKNSVSMFKKNDTKFICEICSIKFASQFNLAAHKDLIHGCGKKSTADA